MLAQRKRGMWTGGPTPWGYRLEAGKLLVDAEAAERVRQVFAHYLATGSVLDTVRFASQWRHFDKTTMRRFLSSPVLVGMLRAGDAVVQGAHEAIVDRATWDRVQARLTSRAPAPVRVRGPRSEALLAGLAYCTCGASMHQHFAARHGRRYSYTVCARALKEGAAACPASRVATADLDRFVVDRVLGLAREPAVVDAIVLESRRQVDARLPVAEQELAEIVADRARLEGEHRNIVEAIAAGGGRALVERLREVEGKTAELVEPERVLRDELAGLRAIDEQKLRAAAGKIETVWPDLFPAEQRRVVRLVVERVVFTGVSNDVAVQFRAAGLVAL